MKFSLLVLTLAVSLGAVLGKVSLDQELDMVIQSLLDANTAKAEQVQKKCSCLDAFDVFVETSNVGAAASSGPHEIEVSFKTGKNETFQLTAPPPVNTAKLYTFPVDTATDCHSIFDLTGITVQAVSTDGWNIRTIVTVLADNKGRTYSGSIDREVNRWIDHQDLPVYESFPLSLSGHQ